MNIELTSTDLLVVPLNGAFIWIILQLLVRPWFRPRAAEEWYPAAMNTIAVFIGLVGAIAATAIPGYSYENILNAVLVGLGGAVVAIGGNEMVGNMASWYSDRRG